MMNKHISHIGRPGGYGSDMDVFFLRKMMNTVLLAKCKGNIILRKMMTNTVLAKCKGKATGGFTEGRRPDDGTGT